jgi:hypothetical protein
MSSPAAPTIAIEIPSFTESDSEFRFLSTVRAITRECFPQCIPSSSLLHPLSPQLTAAQKECLSDCSKHLRAVQVLITQQIDPPNA